MFQNDPAFLAKAAMYKTACVAVDTNQFAAGEFVAVRFDPTPAHPDRFRCFNNKAVDAIEWLLSSQLTDFVL